VEIRVEITQGLWTAAGRAQELGARCDIRPVGNAGGT
jgi:hypothetical protein